VLEVTFAVGAHVRVRGRQWTIEEIQRFPDCALLRLIASSPARSHSECKLLYPFDRPTVQEPRHHVRTVSRRKWFHALGSQLANSSAYHQLQAATTADIDILPYQLEPALAVVMGLASRVLIADEVGLGKTIQAGLILAELRRRGGCERALIVTPAGLREQWADELRRRFNIHTEIFDAARLAHLSNSLPQDLNPWTIEPVGITSIDFVKQPEVVRPLISVIWDLLIVDEAHRVGVASHRASVIRTLADRSRHVVLLTATPHSGDNDTYRSLCDIGKLGDEDQLVSFRRTRVQIGKGTRRRTCLLSIRLTAEEYSMHSTLAQYVMHLGRRGHERGDTGLLLLATVLCKRAFSSAASLAATLERRLRALAPGLVKTPEPTQSMFPFELEGDEPPEGTLKGDLIWATPAFESVEDERRMLDVLLSAALAASRCESKLHALARMLRRVREPAIVFTEYRDSLEIVREAVPRERRVALLHGGLDRYVRSMATRAFSTGRADVLLATDAGAEGLNLQRTCRLVINLELPWNPVRLEQRIGRVDRLGQSKPVHAVHLFARDTAESHVLARLLERVDRIRSEADITLEVLHHIQARP